MNAFQAEQDVSGHVMGMNGVEGVSRRGNTIVITTYNTEAHNELRRMFRGGYKGFTVSVDGTASAGQRRCILTIRPMRRGVLRITPEVG